MISNRKFYWSIVVFSLLAIHSWLPLWGQEVVTARITDLVAHEINALPGSSTNVYFPPSGADKTKWKSLITKLVAKEYATAAQEATAIGYEVVQVKDGALNLYLLRKTSESTNYWGTYAFNDAPDRPQLVIQSPHAIKDRNTGLQGINVFRDVSARAFFLTGTNRCNSLSSSSCSGTTSICGTSEKYKISDVAHNVTSGFQIVTEILNDAEKNYFVQLHGFTKKSADPYAILSLGARAVQGTNRMAEIERNLYNEDKSLTFKNSSNTSWSRLLAFTNTQGRYINAGSDPCGTNAPSANGRFIHIEQEYSKLRAGLTEWGKMSKALAATFANQNTITAVDGQPRSSELSIYPNPVENELSIKNDSDNELNFKILTLSGSTILNSVIARGASSISTGFMKSGVYLFVLSDGRKILNSGKLVKE